VILVSLIVLFTLLCVAAEWVKGRTALSAELLRKLVHMPAAAFAAALPWLIPFDRIAALGLIFTAIMAVSQRARIFSAIHGVARRTYGEILFPLGIAVLAVACPHRLAFAYGVLVLGLGDGLAALVGGRLGRRRVPLLRTRKTLWGTGTFLAVCFALGAAMLATAGASAPRVCAASLAVALALTPVELILVYGLDNLLLPVLGALLLSGL